MYWRLKQGKKFDSHRRSYYLIQLKLPTGNTICVQNTSTFYPLINNQYFTLSKNIDTYRIVSNFFIHLSYNKPFNKRKNIFYG